MGHNPFMEIEKYVTVVELPTFLSEVGSILSNTEKDELINYIAQNPEKGDEIQRTGGLRKLRWAAKGKGKRGGARVIYYFYNYSEPVFLLYAYGKGKQEDLAPAQEKTLSKMCALLKEECKKRRKQYEKSKYWQ